MVSSKANIVSFRAAVVLAALVALLVVSSAGPLHAQQNALKQLTKKNLIGNSVSFSNSDYSEIDKAIQRFRNGDTESALEFLKSAKAKYPKLPPVEVILAKMYFAVRNANAIKAGRILLERTIVNDPKDPEAYLLLADQAFVNRRITEAFALFELVDPLVQEFSGNSKRKQDFSVRLLAGRAAVAESRQQWEEALIWLKKWVDLAPENAAGHQRLGSTLFHLKKPKEALQSLRKSRELNAQVPHPYVALGRLFSRDGDNEKAYVAFSKAYEEDKKDVKVAQAFAEWLIQQDKLDEAQKIAEAMVAKTPDSISALMMDGIVAQMQRRDDHAIQTMTKILNLDPSHFIATDMLSLLLIESEQASEQDRALRYAQMNSQRFPENARANVTRAWILHRMGREAEFKEALQKLGRSQVPIDSAFLIAKIMAEQGKNDAAIQELERLLKQKGQLFVSRREAEALLTKLKSE